MLIVWGSFNEQKREDHTQRQKKLDNLTVVGTHRIRGKCSYPCLTLNVLLHIAVCSAPDALLGIVSICEAGRPIPGRQNLTPVGTYRIQCKCGYPCLTLNTLLHIVVCSARDALFGIVSIYEAWETYTG